MMNWTLTFLIIAIVAAVLGYGGIAGAATEMAKTVFIISIAIWIATVIFGVFRR